MANESINNAPVLPATPPECLGTGAPCEGCPMLPSCGYLEIGRRVVALEQRAETAEERIVVAEGAAEEAKWDKVAPNFLTRAGLENRLATDEQLRGELRRGEAGVLRFDIRGLTFVNNTMSHPDGDMLLKIAANRIAKAVRSGRNPSYPEERRRNTPEEDIVVLVRPSGDEFEVIMRGTTQADFHKAAKRVAASFTIDKAIEDDSHGLVPVASSIGARHVKDMSRRRQWQISDDVLSGYEVLSRGADYNSVRSRRDQYRDMWWNHVVDAEPSLARFPVAEGHITPSKDVVMNYFLRLFCPNFTSNPRETLTRGITAEVSAK